MTRATASNNKWQRRSREAWREVLARFAASGLEDPEQAAAAATPYLRLTALTVIAYLWSRMALVATHQLAAGAANTDLLDAKLVSARFFFEKLLPESAWLLADIKGGAGDIMALTEQQWRA